MAEKLMIQSIVTDNRITAQFSDKQLPRYARHGELYVVNGILFIYADLDNSNHGRWFPLTDQKEIYTYETTNASNIWTIPIDFQTDNIQIIVYDEQDKIYVKDFTVDVDADQVQIVFEESVAGQAYLVINKAFDWVDRRFIVADRNFAVTENELVPNEYFMEINTKYVEMLKNGNTTLKSDLTVGGALNVTGATTFTGDQTLGGNVDIGGNLSVGGTITVVNKLIAQDILELTSDLLVGGNAVITGDLTVKGTTTTIQTQEIKLDDNIVTLNANAVGTPTQNAGIEVERGDEGITTIIQWDETNDVTNIPNNTTINGNLQVDGDTNIDGNLTIQGDNVNINTTTLTVEDNVITINKGFAGIPTENAGLEIDRGDEGVLPLVTFNEATDYVTIPVKQQNGTFLQDEVAGKIYVNTEIDKEEARAIGAETVLTNSLNSEVTRATNAEAVLQTNIDNEKTARIAGDNTLTTNLDAEINRATTAENTLRTDLNTEITDRETADTNLQTQITNEEATRIAAYNTLTTNLNNEVTRATNAETTLQTNIETEKGRIDAILSASTADKDSFAEIVTLINSVDTENDTAFATYVLSNDLRSTTIENDLNSEVTRATTVEADLQTQIINEETARIDTDNTLTTNLDNEVTRATNAETTLQTQITNEVTRASTTESLIQTELDNTQTGAGLNTDGSYNVNTSSNYLTSASSLKDADDKLDSQIKTNNDAIVDEVTRATNVEADLQTQITNEVTRASDVEITLQTNIANEVTRATNVEADLQTQITNEVTRATTVETTLQANIDTEKGRIDGILSASTADLDSFAEIVSLINSVDTTNDTAFASYVLSNDQAIDDILNGVTPVEKANKWTTSRTITFSGDMNGEITIDGSSNVICTTTVPNRVTKYTDNIVVASGASWNVELATVLTETNPLNTMINVTVLDTDVASPTYNKYINSEAVVTVAYDTTHIYINNEYSESVTLNIKIWS